MIKKKEAEEGERGGNGMDDEATGRGRIRGRRKGGKTTKGCHTGGGDDNNNYATPPPPPKFLSAPELSYSEPVIPFGFEGQGAVATLVIYTKLVFSLFAQGYILVLLGSSYLSSSTGAGTE